MPKPEPQNGYSLNPNHCPFCQSTAIKEEDHDLDPPDKYCNEHRIEVRCKSCGRHWVNVFRLVRFFEVQRR